MHPFSYLSSSQGMSKWILHSSWLPSIQHDRLISTLSKSTPAPPVKAVSLLRSRWGPPSNKRESWFHTMWPARCEVRPLRTSQSMLEHVVLMKDVRNGWNLHGILEALGGCLLGGNIIITQWFVQRGSSRYCNRDNKPVWSWCISTKKLSLYLWFVRQTDTRSPRSSAGGECYFVLAGRLVTIRMRSCYKQMSWEDIPVRGSRGRSKLQEAKKITGRQSMESKLSPLFPSCPWDTSSLRWTLWILHRSLTFPAELTGHILKTKK